MLKLTLRGVDISLSFSFFAIIALAAACDAGAVMISLLCCMMHEAGHLLAMLRFGAKPKGICFYGGGIKITASPLQMSTAREAAVLLAGCAVNACAFAVCFAAGRGMSEFAAANLLLCAFNLLPFRRLDGGKLSELMTGSSRARYEAFNAVRVVALAVVLFLLIDAFASGAVSFTLAAAAVYIVLSEALD